MNNTKILVAQMNYYFATTLYFLSTFYTGQPVFEQANLLLSTQQNHAYFGRILKMMKWDRKARLSI